MTNTQNEAIRSAALEEAAKVADDYWPRSEEGSFYGGGRVASNEIATAIRSLKSQPTPVEATNANSIAVEEWRPVPAIADVQGHLADAVRDAARIVSGAIVSFDASDKMAAHIIQHLRDIPAAPGTTPAKAVERPKAQAPRPYPHAVGDTKYQEYFGFEGGSLTIRTSGPHLSPGSGWFCFRDDECDIEDDEGRTYYVSNVDNSELIAIRDWLVGVFPTTPAKAVEGEDLRSLIIDIRDNGLIYWEPNTQRGHVNKALMLARIDTALATPTKPLAVEAEEMDILDWLNNQHALELQYYSPMYCDDDDQAEEWRVYRRHGSINDREWAVIGRGETAADALLDAQRKGAGA